MGVPLFLTATFPVTAHLPLSRVRRHEPSRDVYNLGSTVFCSLRLARTVSSNPILFLSSGIIAVMFAFSLVVSALLASQSLASPISTDLATRASGIDLGQFLCHIPFVPKALCTSNTKRGSKTVSTPIGTATGVADGSGVRFAVKYGKCRGMHPIFNDDMLNGEPRLRIPMGAFYSSNGLGTAVCALFSFSDVLALYSHVGCRNGSTEFGSGTL